MRPHVHGRASMKAVSRIAAACFMVALPLLIITTSVRFFAGEIRFYERGFREYDSDQRTGLPLSELDRAAGDVVHYFENDADTLRIIVNDDGQEVSLYNTRETEHMRDVKSVMRFIFRVNEVTLAYVMAYVAAVYLWSGERPLRTLAKQALAAMAGGLVVVGAIAVAASLGFDAAWTRFHEIVFRNDLWLLNPATDRLIQMFPEPFWEEATFIVGGMIAAQGIAITVLAASYLLFSRNGPAVENAPTLLRGRRISPGRPE